MSLRCFILSLFCFSISSNAFSQNCLSPLVDQLFQPKFNSVKAQPDDELRYDIATLILENNCYTSLQIKYISRLFIQDDVRYNFAVKAFKHCADTENYYDVLDAFKNYGYAFRLYDFIKASKKQNHQTNNPENNTATPSPCRISDSDFNQAKTSVNNETVSSSQLVIAKEIVRSKKCFLALQIKELTELFSIESYRLDFAKYSYDFTVDKENYYLIADAFSTNSSKSQLMEFLRIKK